jgi:acetolactate synthase-1/2/3 large subunit
VDAVFGLPGVHTLGIWEGMRVSPALAPLSFRHELNASWAADGYARATGRVAPLLVSTGPGALITLAGIMEAAHSYDPVVAITTVVPGDEGFGHGHLHELRDQRASFEPLVKWSGRAASHDSIPFVLQEAFRAALSPPTGPAYVEVPLDLVHEPTAIPVIESLGIDFAPSPTPPAALMAEAARRLGSARQPLICAGGGAVRADASAELQELARRIDAPVASTYSGKGVYPETDPRSLGSGWDERALLEELDASDVVLCVGSSLGRDTTNWTERQLDGRLIHIDVNPERVGYVQSCLPLVGDAKATLAALLDQITGRESRGEGAARAQAVRARIEAGLATQDRHRELSMVRAIEQSLPAGAGLACDSTILGYMAAAHLRMSESRRFLYPLGSGTIGYAWPASLGAAAGLKGPVLAVAGDGGFLYGLSELATARELGLSAKLLLIDDGGYGILRQYQQEAGFDRFEVDHESPDFVSVCAAFSVPARRISAEDVAEGLDWALSINGPAAVIVEAEIFMLEPTL